MFIIKVLLCACFLFWKFTPAPAEYREVLKVVSINKGSVLLPCAIELDVTVSWISPRGDHVVIEGAITSKFKKVAEVVGVKQSGEHHLLLKYSVYPDHVGLWLCIAGSPVLKTFTNNLTLLVPPPEMKPSISFREMFETEDSELFIITCTGHFALPPVVLSWNRKSGPDIETSVPKYIVSANGLVSVSIDLILTKKHFGSTYECSARHETYPDLTTAYFNFSTSPNSLHKSYVYKRREVISLGSADKSFLLIVVMFTLCCFVVPFVLCRFKHVWRWKQTSGTDTYRGMQMLNNEIQIQGGASPPKSRYRDCNLLRNKLAFLCQLLLLLALLLALSVYYKGLEIPSQPGIDQVVPVFIGSAAWLDCRSLFHVDNLLRIKWTFNGEAFYFQHVNNSKNIGYHQNTSIGIHKGARLSFTKIGQITIWPILLGHDEGLYTCEVLTGGQEIRKMVIQVYVLSKPSSNHFLIGLMFISILCSICVLMLLFFNCIQLFLCKKKELEMDCGGELGDDDALRH